MIVFAFSVCFVVENKLQRKGILEEDIVIYFEIALFPLHSL